MNKAYIGLGSNLNSPIKNIESAIEAFHAEPGIHVLRSSSFYMTAPWGYADQDDFINAVIEIETTLSPEALLTVCHSIEKILGKQRLFTNGPRTIDCDILLFDDLVLTTEELTIPHPRMHLRLFDLIPLQELVGDIVLHHHGRLSECIHQIRDQKIRLIEDQPVFS
jgi:2-amino-4-hydroxy-6-hydroxymethyldihydropteridine diphosphokinase